MTRLRGATVADFKDALIKMKEIYPYDDEKTYVVSDSNQYSEEHSCLEIHTVDENGTGVTLYREIKCQH